MGYNDKYPRTYHLPFSPGTTNDDKIAYDFNELLNNEIVITEKLDGQNNCINKDGVYARSHVMPSEHPWDSYLKPHQSMLKPALDGLEIFGESMYAIHSIEYSGLQRWFYVFGVRIEGRVWVSWDDVVEYSKMAGWPSVPLLWRGVVSSAKELEDLIKAIAEDSESTLKAEDPRMRDIRADKDADLDVMEGVVVRTAGPIIEKDFSKKVMKYVRENHVQTDEHWTKNWKRAWKESERKARLKI